MRYIISIILITISFECYCQSKDYVLLNEDKYLNEVTKFLKRMDFEHTVSEFGSIFIKINFADGRSQSIHFDWRPIVFSGYSMYKISSPSIVYDGDNPLNMNILLGYFNENRYSKLGFWQIGDKVQPYFLEYSCVIDIKAP